MTTMDKRLDLLQGTLDMLILRTLLFGPAHGHEIARHIQQTTDDVLQPDTDVEITPFAESQYMVEAVTYRAQIGDAIERRVYIPVIRAVWAAAQLVRRAHTGSVHLYLAYGALGVLIMLVVAR